MNNNVSRFKLPHKEVGGSDECTSLLHVRVDNNVRSLKLTHIEAGSNKHAGLQLKVKNDIRQFK
jgi:hypothetical protein